MPPPSHLSLGSFAILQDNLPEKPADIHGVPWVSPDVTFPILAREVYYGNLDECVYERYRTEIARYYHALQAYYNKIEHVTEEYFNSNCGAGTS